MHSIVLSRHNGNRGIALVLVLATLVLISALATAFFISAKTDMKASRGYSDGADALRLADSTVNLVQATLIAATTGTDAQGRPLTWASQPGMIRTYDEAGAFATAYRLYSSASGLVLSASATVDAAAEAARTANWAKTPAHFTDLNEPAATLSGTAYPILNPAAEGQIEGFSFGGTVPLPPGVTKGQMPVHWLYVLRDGQIVAPDFPAGATDTVVVSAANAANPIVGRIAFWTDDECAKINVNTASTGTCAATSGSTWTQTFWDTPRGFTFYERALGNFQPFKNEFQRYPGHPATTDMALGFPSSIRDTIIPDNIFNMAPRYVSGTSVRPGSNMARVAVPRNTASLTPASLKANRLYSSVDELMFTPARGQQAVNATGSRFLSPEQLEQSRFFLTASSRAPEVNLFNQPRVAMWPVSARTGAGYRTAEDEAIAFCATTKGNAGDNPYYFQRLDPASPTNDYQQIARNRQLLGYLQRLTESRVPGFGGGTAGFRSKYGDDHEQILTEIFDYIRCTNLNDQGVGSPFAPKGQVTPIAVSLNGQQTLGFGRFAMPAEIAMDFVCMGRGRVIASGSVAAAGIAVDPAQPPFFAGTDGNGMPSDNTVAIQALLVMSFMVPSMGTPTYCPDFTVKIEGMDQFKLGTANAAATGFPASASTYVHAGKNSGGNLEACYFVANKTLNRTDPMQFPFFSNIIEVPYSKNDSVHRFAFTGGKIKITIYAGNSTQEADKVAELANITIPDSASSTYSRTGATNTLPNATHYNIPGRPDAACRLVGSLSGTYTIASPAPSGAADRFVTSPGSATYSMFGSNNSVSPWGGQRDTVQSVVIGHGDARMLFRRALDDGSGNPIFVQNTSVNNNPGFECVNANFANIVGDTQAYQRCGAGRLVQGLAASNNFHEPVPPTLSAGAFVNNDAAALQQPGDWDAGLPSTMNGPYINKPDEGDLTQLAASAATNWKTYIPYHGGYTSYTPVVGSYFSPNRQVPSSGMLGSLPTGVKANMPWRTLLFRPDVPSPTGMPHPGAGVFGGLYDGTHNAPGAYSVLPDHLFMDMLWMPVVEPYPISEPFSTAGKVNMNYQMMPFAFINRDTAVRAVLKGERPMAVPSTPGVSTDITTNWKDLNNVVNIGALASLSQAAKNFIKLAVDFRYDVNLEETLTGFRQRFAANDLFRSASEIALIPLVPVDNPADGSFNPVSVPGFPLPAETYASMFKPDGFWFNHALTGDNVRERPYANIYPRLTTKSNTFTIHYRVQTLKKRTADPHQNQWVNGQDKVTGEYRGSSTIERYIDPNASLPDYATDAGAAPLDSFYKFRVISVKQFAP